MSQEATSSRDKPVGWRRALLRRFYRGATARAALAIEFTLLAIPFFHGSSFAVLESSISFAAQQVMANAADDIARQFPHRPDQGRRFLQAGSARSDLRPHADRGQPRLPRSRGRFPVLCDLRASSSVVRVKFENDGDLDTDEFVYPAPATRCPRTC